MRAGLESGLTSWYSPRRIEHLATRGQLQSEAIMPAPFLLARGEKVDQRYEVLRHIDVGGMGVVYEATDVLNGQRVALKFLKHIDANSTQRTRFINEAVILQGLRHRNVLQFKTFVMPQATPLCLVTEFVDGGSLTDLLAAADPRRDALFRLRSGLSHGLALELLRQCAAGLSYIHAQGIAHRDLKPANLLLIHPPERVLSGTRTVLKIADFGIASSDIDDGPTLTVAGSFVGTHLYAAPEHLAQIIKFVDDGARGRCDRTVAEEQRADVFGLGLIFYETWTGRPLVSSDNRHPHGVYGRREVTDLRALEDALGRFRSDTEGIDATDPELNLLRRLLAREPAERPTAAQAAAELDRLCGITGDEDHRTTARGRATFDSGMRPDSMSPREEYGVESSAGRRRAGALAAGVAILGLLGVGVWAGTQLERPGELSDRTDSSGARETEAARVGLQAALTASDDRIAPTQAPTTSQPPPRPSATPPPQLTPQPTPQPARAAQAPAGSAEAVAVAASVEPSEPKRVSCIRELSARDRVPDPEEVVRQFPLEPMPESTRCFQQGADVWQEAAAPLGSRVYAPADGNLRFMYSRRPDGANSMCAVIETPDLKRIKVCGLDKRRFQVTKGPVEAGRWIGTLDATARMTWQILPPKGIEGVDSRDLRTYLPR